MWHLCCTRVILVSQFRCSFPTDVALVLLFLHSSRTGFVRFAIMLLVSSTRVVKLARSSPKAEKMFKNTNIVFEFRHTMKVGVKKSFFSNGTPNSSEALIFVQRYFIKIPKL